MAKQSFVVKRRDHVETYDRKKIYGSVYAAALNCHYHEQDAEKLAEKVMKKVDSWMTKRKMVDSADIKKEITKHITDDDVIMMYEEHLDIC